MEKSFFCIDCKGPHVPEDGDYIACRKGRGFSPVPQLEVEERQLLAMALAELSLTCPGFNDALEALAGRFSVDVRMMRDGFRLRRADIVKPIDALAEIRAGTNAEMRANADRIFREGDDHG